MQLQVHLLKNASEEISPNMCGLVRWEGDSRETSQKFVLVEGIDVGKKDL